MSVQIITEPPFPPIWVSAPRSMAAALHGESVFTFVRNCPTALRSGCSVFHSHRRWVRSPMLYNLAGTWCSVSWMLAILTGVWWHLMVLTCGSLMTYAMESFHMPFAACICSFGRCLGTAFANFLIGLFILLLSFTNSLHILDNSLYHMSSAYIFSQCVACLLMILTLSFTGRSCLI